jgi:hypothetical protein
VAGDPVLTDAERAALAVAEAATRLSDRTDPVPDEIWDEVADHYDKQHLAALVLWIATTNVFNRRRSKNPTASRTSLAGRAPAPDLLPAAVHTSSTTEQLVGGERRQG